MSGVTITPQVLTFTFTITPVTTISTSRLVVGEEMVGDKDGLNTTFTFPGGKIPVTNKEMIFLNGQCLRRNVGYTIVAGEIEMTTAPTSDDYLWTTFWSTT